VLSFDRVLEQDIINLKPDQITFHPFFTNVCLKINLIVGHKTEKIYILCIFLVCILSLTYSVGPTCTNKTAVACSGLLPPVVFGSRTLQRLFWIEQIPTHTVPQLLDQKLDQCLDFFVVFIKAFLAECKWPENNV